MRHVRSIVITAGVFALALGASAPATMAQQPEPLVGCVKPGTGLLRILEPGDTCKPGETPLGFNDLPLLVALRQQVMNLQTTVEELQTMVQMLEERVQSLEQCTAQLCSPE
jgi:hypothetical protein